MLAGAPLQIPLLQRHGLLTAREHVKFTDVNVSGFLAVLRFSLPV